MDPYHVLGVRQGAGDNEIDLAYKGRRAQYHPDRYAGESPETIAWATGMMQQVNAAYAMLSDSAQRRDYDASRRAAPKDADQSSQSNRATPDPPRQAQVRWSEYLAASVVPQLTLSRVFCVPAIPAGKLEKAIRAYGQGIDPREVSLLLDDTVWGGADRGMIVTDTEIRLRDLRDQWQVPFSELGTIEAVGQSVVLNESARTASFALQDELGLKCILWTLTNYLETSRHCSASEAEPDLHSAHRQQIAAICQAHMQQGVFASAKGCWVYPEIPAEVIRMVRFVLGIGNVEEEELLAVYVLSPDACTEVFAVTTRGLHSKTDEGWKFLAWGYVRFAAVAGEFASSVRCGVEFNDGTTILCSRLRGDRQTFGAALIKDCILALNA